MPREQDNGEPGHPVAPPPRQPIDYRRANEMPPRGDELLRVFIRFEFALKATGFIMPNKERAEPWWERFVQQLPKDFWRSEEVRGLAPTILSKPPSRQIVEGTSLGFEKEVPPARSNAELLAHVRWVRNNLAHGGKAGDPDADRNTRLVAEAIAVLDACLHQHDDMRYAFEGRG